MKTRKIVLPMLSLLLIGGLAACSSDPKLPTEPVTSIRLSRLNLGLLLNEETNDAGEATGNIVGEEYQLSVSSLPRQVNKPTIKFSSSDEKVATVDQNGLVKAVGEGKCEIIAANEDDSVKTSCPVFVGKSKSRSEANKVANAIKEAQSSISVDTVRKRAYWNNKIIKNDVVQQDSYFDREMVLSRSNAYFKIYDYDTNIKVQDGSASYGESGWIFYTNEYFDTYLFRNSPSAKNYMIADSTSYISQGKTRFDALCAVLDNFFTAGSKIATGLFTDVLGNDQNGPLNSVATSKRRGSAANDQLILSVAQSGKQTADQEDESDYYIPADTVYDVKIDLDYILDENFVKSEKVYQGFLYSLGEDKYENAFYIDNDYEYRNIELEYPNVADYQRVETLFDL